MVHQSHYLAGMGGVQLPLFEVKFCMQLPKAACLEAFPHLVRLLGAEANVTHSYAAIAIDRMLTQKVHNMSVLGWVCKLGRIWFGNASAASGLLRLRRGHVRHLLACGCEGRQEAEHRPHT